MDFSRTAPSRLGPELPWPKKRLAKLGKAIAAEEPVPDGCPHTDEVLSWYLELGLAVHQVIADLEWEPLLGHREPNISWRIKTIDTLREKLQRDRRFPLPNIDDIAGVRFEAEMTLDEQDAVVNALEALFRDRGVRVETRDYRVTGGHSGYRAVHLLLHLSGRVELQIRTELQGRWANLYEVLADRVGRQIRYDQLPESPAQRDLVVDVQRLSSEFLRDMEEGLRRDRILSFDHDPMADTTPSAIEVEERRRLWNEAKLRLRRLEDTIRELGPELL